MPKLTLNQKLWGAMEHQIQEGYYWEAGYLIGYLVGDDAEFTLPAHFVKEIK